MTWWSPDGRCPSGLFVPWWVPVL